MIRLLIILLLIIGCDGIYIPEDCAGVAGGDAVEDNCGTSDYTSCNEHCHICSKDLL